MGYQLGVDLGTTYTAAGLHRDGRVELVPLGDRSTVMPSVAFIRPDGEVLVGEAANRRGLVEPERVAREFKRRVGDPTPMLVGGSPYPADALIAHLLRAVVAQVAEREGGGPDGLALTHPANWGAYKLDFFMQAVGHAGLGDLPVTLLPEPEAAALHYAASERVPPGAVVAVYDLGGGTFDAAVLRRDERGFELVGRPEGIERLGGVDFDAGVFAHVDAALDGAVSELDEHDELAVQAVARLRAECVEAKEALSRDVEVAIPVVLPTRATTVRLTRAELEAMIRPALAETITALRAALRSAGAGSEDVHAVLLVGGSSRIPLVGQMVSAELGRPIAVDAHPKHAVALGAAAAAAAAHAASAGPDAVTIVPMAETAVPPAPVLPPLPGPLPPPTPGPADPVPPGTAATGTAPPPPAAAVAGDGDGEEAPLEPPPPAVRRGSAADAVRKRPALAVAAAIAVLLGAVMAANAALGGGGDGSGGTTTTTAIPARVADRQPAPPDIPDPEPADVPEPAAVAVTTPPEPDVPAAAGTPPTSTDPDLQAYVDGCAGDAVGDCDRLYNAADSESPAYAYGRTCGNRLAEEEANGDCLVRFDAIPSDPDEQIQTWIEGCAGDAVDDCDRLYNVADPDSPANTYGRTCGHRLDDDEANGDCLVRYNAIPSDSDEQIQTWIEGCAGDAVDDCDRLYNVADAGSPANTYGRTCGHRLDDDESNGDCLVWYNAIPSDSDEQIQAWIEGCADGAVDDCDRLYNGAMSGSPAYVYGRTCGHRLDDDESNGDCLVWYNAIPGRIDPGLEPLVEACSEDEVAACDELYRAAASGDPAYTYGRTCGHRMEEAEASGDCATRT